MTEEASRSRAAGSPEAHPRRGARVLYLSYDGMCDPLGRSQVLPYLVGLAKLGHRISLISFEKAERSAEEREAVARLCKDAGIAWHPMAYHKRPRLLSSMYDIWQMRRLAHRLHAREGFEFSHCRSDLPALVGLWMKRRFGLPFIFDMRGLWADERLDGGIWKLSNPLMRMAYEYFKRREIDFLSEAAHVVSLTKDGERVVRSWRPIPEVGPPITVIPCCADFGAFPPIQASDRTAARRLLGIEPNARVAVYLGSFGGWNLVAEMLDFFRVQLERDPQAIFLIVSHQPREEIVAAAQARGIPPDRVVVRAASRPEVPKLVAAADYGIFLIKPAFSKKASSPTKMGEFLALELPIVTNGEVGDVAQIVEESGAGVLIERFDAAAYRRALDQLERLRPDMQRWREAAHRWFDLELGVTRFDEIYRAVKQEGARMHACPGQNPRRSK